MKQKILMICTLLALCLGTILFTTQIGRTQLVNRNEFGIPNQPNPYFGSPPTNVVQTSSTACALRPDTSPTASNLPKAVVPTQLPLSRFRQVGYPVNPATATLNNLSSSTRPFSSYQPKESIALADPTNYGDRFVFDLYGRPAYYPPIVVIHETVGSARSAINLFQTRHSRDAQQVSYHALIKRDGEIVYLVPPDKRAFGAGNSVFQGTHGQETVKTHPNYPPSVNNFAYHVSLETPRDGSNNRNRHSGYTQTQYQSLAWLVAKTGVPYSRITTHKGVDRSGSRKDPRSFDESRFLGFLQVLPQTQEIVIGCQPPQSY
ncbi:MAG TPA: peptidoglycan recognition family protein [Coleofasciculaceae cyanobacterium]